jgi:ubiquinone/menaquinone biosynthesis C-methylase UbiE
MGGASLTEAEAAAVRAEVEKVYARVANEPGGEFHFHRGAAYAVAALGYDRAALASLPEIATRSFAGVGNPHLMEPFRPGEVVVDVGAGAGTDLLLAARKVGAAGRAIGIDLTDDMIRSCRASIAAAGVKNAEVSKGDAERLPVEDSSADVVISNGVMNLVPDKERAFREVFRVLRPGGRFYFSDIVVRMALPQAMRCNTDLWAA